MNTTATTFFSEEEKDILQEMMNIAFGKAAADLAEVIDIYVILSAPHVNVLRTIDIPEYISAGITDYNYDRISIVEQNFWGKFKGSAFLVLPAGVEKTLISMLKAGNDDYSEEDTGDVIEKGIFVEVGNILIGACVGKISELLGDVVTYLPPTLVVDKHPRNFIPGKLFAPDKLAIVLKTVFRFTEEEEEIGGFLFLVISDESAKWLREALSAFLEQYE